MARAHPLPRGDEVVAGGVGQVMQRMHIDGESGHWGEGLRTTPLLFSGGRGGRVVGGVRMGVRGEGG